MKRFCNLSINYGLLEAMVQEGMLMHTSIVKYSEIEGSSRESTHEIEYK
jgi:hypothetical protein